MRWIPQPPCGDSLCPPSTRRISQASLSSCSVNGDRQHEGQFTAVFQQVPEGYIRFVEELPRANTQGDTLDEARTNLAQKICKDLEIPRP